MSMLSYINRENQPGRQPDRGGFLNQLGKQNAERGRVDIVVFAHTDGPDNPWVKESETATSALLFNPLGKFTIVTFANKHIVAGI